jgi:16S rRNA (guanine527-N7)-methyltransferase
MVPAVTPRPALLDVLEESRRLGFFGPGQIEHQVLHAAGFFEIAAREPVQNWLDLGSGGGLPGLVLIDQFPSAVATLLDAMEKRTAFLSAAVRALGVERRCSVVRARAEEFVRTAGQADSFDLVVARSFGPPALTAECAAAFLRIDGRLLISEPPDSTGARWSGLNATPLGLMVESLERLDVGTFVVIRKMSVTPGMYPRRGAPLSKRPLFS